MAIVKDKTHDLLINKGYEQYETGHAVVTKFNLAQLQRGEEREVLRRPANKDKDGDVPMYSLAHQDLDALTPEKESEEEDAEDEGEWDPETYYKYVLDAIKGKGSYKGASSKGAN